MGFGNVLFYKHQGKVSGFLLSQKGSPQRWVIAGIVKTFYEVILYSFVCFKQAQIYGCFFPSLPILGGVQKPRRTIPKYLANTSNNQHWMLKPPPRCPVSTARRNHLPAPNLGPDPIKKCHEAGYWRGSKRACSSCLMPLVQAQGLRAPAYNIACNLRGPGG